MCRSLPDSSGFGCLLHCAICQPLCLCKSWCKLLLSLSFSEVILPLCELCLVAISLLSFAKLSCNKIEKRKEGGSWVKQEVVNSKQNGTVFYSGLMQMSIFETAVETRVKSKSRDCVKASSAAYLWLLHWALQGSTSLSKHHCSVLFRPVVWFRYGIWSTIWGRVCWQTSEEWELRCTWLWKESGHSWSWEMWGSGKSSSALSSCWELVGKQAYLGGGKPHSAC